ncbi:unnamed protein product [Bathycoccus prasinos]
MVFVSATNDYEILQTRFGMENTSRNGVEILAASHGFVFVCPEEPITSNVPGVVNDEGAANLIKAARALIRHQPCEKFGARVAKSQIAVVGYSMGGGSAIRAASEEEEAPQRARRALAPFNGFVNVKDVEIPSLLIVGASDVVTRPSEVELVYDERIASKQKALIILRDRSHEHAVTSSAGVAIGRDEDKEEQEVDKLAMAAMESILNRKSKEKESEEDPSVEIQRVRARGF